MTTSGKAIIAAAVAAMPATPRHEVLVTTDSTATLIENWCGGVPGMTVPILALNLPSSTIETEGRQRVTV